MDVLVVSRKEDRSALVATIRTLGHSVTPMGALPRLGDLPAGRPDLIVVDGGDGPGGVDQFRHFCQRLGQHFGPDPPFVIAVVAAADLHCVPQLIEAGADDLFCKTDSDEVIELRIRVAERTIRERRRWSAVEAELGRCTTDLLALAGGQAYPAGAVELPFPDPLDPPIPAHFVDGDLHSNEDSGDGWEALRPALAGHPLKGSFDDAGDATSVSGPMDTIRASLPRASIADDGGSDAVDLDAFGDIDEHRMLALESITDGFFAVDAGWRLTYVNDEAEIFLAAPRAELLGRSLWDVLPDVVGSPLESALRRAAIEATTVRLEAFIASREAWYRLRIFPFDGGLSVYTVDVTARREAYEALRKSEAKMRGVLDTSMDGIVTMDDRGVIEEFNAAAERTFGFRAEDVVGQHVSTLLPESYHWEYGVHLGELLRESEGRLIRSGLEVAGQRADGSIFPLDLSLSEVHTSGKRLFTAVVRDLTERRAHEQEVLRAVTEERERIGRDLHDGLCSHLTGVAMLCRAFARGIQRGRPVTVEEAQEAATLVQEGAEQARMLARGLDPVGLSERGLPTALADLVAGLQARAGLPIRLTADIHELTLGSDTGLHLYRITQEALQNALKHASATQLDVELMTDNGHLVLTVRDDGVGLDGAGSDGMGLNVMRYRARSIGASLAIQGGSAGGTVVTCRIPIGPAVLDAPGTEVSASAVYDIAQP
jgi:two-component system, LuxR family, sensor kinase FixL